MKKKPITLWAIMKVHKWESITVMNNIPLQQPAEGPDGFIPVFNNPERAAAWAGTNENIQPLIASDPK